MVHLRTTAEKLWEALTRPENTRLYYDGTEIVTELKPGASIEYVQAEPGGGPKTVITGRILEVDSRGLRR